MPTCTESRSRSVSPFLGSLRLTLCALPSTVLSVALCFRDADWVRPITPSIISLLFLCRLYLSFPLAIVCGCVVRRTVEAKGIPRTAGLYNKAVPFLTADLAAGSALPEATLSGSPATDVLRIRKDFPETWIWPEELLVE